MKRMVLSVLVLSLVLTFACSKKKNSTEPENNTPPALPQQTSSNVPNNAPDHVKGMAAAADAFATSGYGYMAMGYGGQGVQNGNTWTWATTVEAMTVTVKSTLNDDGSSNWQVILNGTDGVNTFNNWVMMAGQVSADQKSASWTVYETGTQTVAATWTMVIDDNGNVTKTIVSGTMKLVSVSNTDGSGSLKEYQNDNLSFEASWGSDGAGSWTAYNADGSVADSGPWT